MQHDGDGGDGGGNTEGASPRNVYALGVSLADTLSATSGSALTMDTKMFGVAPPLSSGLLAINALSADRDRAAKNFPGMTRSVLAGLSSIRFDVLTSYDLEHAALKWLSEVLPTRNKSFVVPRLWRCPRSKRSETGYAIAYRRLGFFTREADTKYGHWHKWYFRMSLEEFTTIQRILQTIFGLPSIDAVRVKLNELLSPQ